MGCPIAMGRHMSADASSHRFVCARVPQSGCNGDFVIDGGGTGGTLGIVHRTVPCLGARLCIRIPTYVVLVVHCMGHANVPASWLGQHSRKLPVLWLRTYVLVLVLTYSPEYSLPQPGKLHVFGNAAPANWLGYLHAPCNALPIPHR